MTTINPNIAATPSYTSFENEVGGSRSSSASLFEAAREQSTDLEITTAEGDRVSLSYGQETSFSMSSYENIAQNGNGFVAERGESLSYESSFGFSFSVEGDLSEEELADIGSLVNDLDSVMGKMLTGDMDGALQEALGVGSFDSIAGFEANLLVEQQVYSEQSYMIEAPSVSSNPGIGAGGGLFNTAAEAGGVLSNPGGSLLDGAMFDEMLGMFDDMIEQMMGSIDDSGVEPEKIEKPFEDYFAALKGSLMEEVPEESPAVQMADLIHSRLMEGLQAGFGEGDSELPGSLEA